MEKGIFSRAGMPSSWQKDGISSQGSEQVDAAVAAITPEHTILGELTRSSNSITYILKNQNGLAVVQVGPPIDDDDEHKDLKVERQNAHKFEPAEKRLTQIAESDVLVPHVQQVGRIPLGQHEREYVIMDFVKGMPADQFISKFPEKANTIYTLAGEALGKLAMVPLISEDESLLSANDALIEKVARATNFLINQGVFSQEEHDKLLGVLQNELSRLPPLPLSYVHFDPFPVNWHVQGNQDNLSLVLMDIEAIGPGHPWLEGIVRCADWAGNWFSLSAEESQRAQQALISGFNRNVPENYRIAGDPVFFRRLGILEELIWLPQGMMFEMLKESPNEKPDRRKKELLEHMESLVQ